VNRLARLALLTVGIASGYLAVKGVRAWLDERRRQEVFPAREAALLLNPLRSVIMPVSRPLDRCDLQPGQTVLELGPGPGWYSREAAHRVGEAGRLICLDIQRDMLDILRQRLDEAGAAAELVVGDAVALPLADGAVDCAFLVTVLGEVPDHLAVVRELARVTKPGGRVCFTESFGDPDYVLAKKLRRLAAMAGLREDGFFRDPFGYTAVFGVPSV
jgi:SAM-dependent methyltransferase